MSSLIFFASDFILEEVKNPYIKILSINESLQQGLDVSESILKYNIDRDKPNTLLWIEDEDRFGEITINEFDKSIYGDCIETTKKYCSELLWVYSPEREKQLMQYIEKHIKIAKEMELWSIWLNNNEDETILEKYFINIKDLTAENIRELTEKPSFEIQRCMVITSTNIT